MGTSPSCGPGINVLLSAGRMSPMRSPSPDPMRASSPPVAHCGPGMSSRDQSPHAVRLRVAPRLASHTFPPTVLTGVQPAPVPLPIDVANILLPQVPTSILPSMTIGSATVGNSTVGSATLSSTTPILRSAVPSPALTGRSFELMGSARLVGATPMPGVDSPPRDSCRETVYVPSATATAAASAAQVFRSVPQVVSSSLPFAHRPRATVPSGGRISPDRRVSDIAQRRSSPSHQGIARPASVDSKPRPRPSSLGMRATVEDAERGRQVRASVL